MRVLLVEDEAPMAEAIGQILRKHNYAVDLRFNGEDGLDCALTGIYDILVLDVMLPKLDGLGLVRALRAHGLDVPVLLLTAKGDTADKVAGLDAGADDYLPKPFSTDELLARLRALGRRRGAPVQGDALALGGTQLLVSSLTLTCGGRQVQLTQKECQLLELLMRCRGTVVGKETIIERVWGFDTEAVDNHVEVYVSFLRKKLAFIQADAAIRTVRGAGYSLEGAGEGDV